MIKHLFPCSTLIPLMLLGACATQSNPTPSVQPDSSQSASFIVFGDSGNIEDDPGDSALLPVASAMKDHCAKQGCDFGLMAGDNIYEHGADGLADRSADRLRFSEAFAIPYDGFLDIDPDFRLYMALGNHDWATSRAGGLAQTDYAENHPPLYMNGPIYKVSPDGMEGLIEIFVVDTEMILAAQHIEKYDLSDDGIPYKTGRTGRGGKSGALPQTDVEKGQIPWLEHALKASDARWKIVLAHHPLWESKGTKYDELLALRPLLRPTICKYADAYMSGHQHTLEVHTDSCDDISGAARNAPLVHVVSGAAGKARSIDPNYLAWQTSSFPNLTTHWANGDVWGFMRADLSVDELILTIFSAEEGQRNVEDFQAVNRLVFSRF